MQVPYARPGPPRSGRSDVKRASVAGVGGGVGTTTLAVAVGGTDQGIFTGHAVDILVCRSTVESVARAARAAGLVAASDTRPVLAVTATDSAAPSRALLARLRLLEPNAAGVVLLPYVPQWRTLTAPLDSVRGLFALPTAELPRPLRNYVSAVGQLEAALRSGHRPSTASRSEPPTRLHAGKERLR